MIPRTSSSHIKVKVNDMHTTTVADATLELQAAPRAHADITVAILSMRACNVGSVTAGHRERVAASCNGQGDAYIVRAREMRTSSPHDSVPLRYLALQVPATSQYGRLVLAF